ncbi:SDR family oxidoreductase [Mycolicibacterium obuense]|uniref:SDR family oxidoreductase n=1 Tax=Mycolicibacterium obuense TaxID=1807 RepID=A0A4R5X9N7_9MYCO|nr:SDR family oxidoreductase [Mycolicibacterium obuense]TDL10485.1 SDR family oxidoreductase [Mycolicibacterium obuense]
MLISVIGASGMIGSQVVQILTAAGHDVVGASLRTGANVLTGEGLDDAVAGAAVLVDVTNSPQLDDDTATDFFTTSSANLVKAATGAGVGHYVALSIVGADGITDSGYMRAKVIQERTIVESGVPFTIVRATQFHEFADAIVGSLAVGDEFHAPVARIQPIASADVAAAVADAAQRAPAGGIVDVGGPEKMTFADLARAVLAQQGKDSTVVDDAAATYFGARVDRDTLVTGDGARLGTQRFTDWLATQ